MIVDSILYGNLKLDTITLSPIIKNYYYYSYEDRYSGFIFLLNNGSIYRKIISDNPTNNYLVNELIKLNINIVGMECFFGNRTMINTWDKLFIKSNITNELYELFIE